MNSLPFVGRHCCFMMTCKVNRHIARFNSAVNEKTNGAKRTSRFKDLSDRLWERDCTEMKYNFRSNMFLND